MSLSGLPPFPDCAQSVLGALPLRLGTIPLRAATLADLPFLVSLYRDSRAEELAHWPGSEAQFAAFCASQFDLQHRHYVGQHPRGEFLIIGDEQEPLGRLSLDRTGAAIHIIDISLKAAARGRGLGTAILSAITARAQRADKPVTLCVLASNVRAQALYRRLGFTGDAQDGLHVAMRWLS